MSTEPQKPDEPVPPHADYEPVEEGYQLAESSYESPPRPQIIPDELTADSGEERPRRKRRRTIRDEAATTEDDPRNTQQPSDLQKYEEVSTAYSWWVVPVGLITFGFILCSIPVGILAVRAGPTAGAGIVAGVLVGLLVQIVAVTLFLMVIGQFFGIDYGPAHEAVVKLAAVVTMVDGMIAVLSIGCTPCGLVVAALVGAGIFQYLFKLAVHEMLLSVAGMVAAAWILNAAVLAVIVHKERKKAGNTEIPVLQQGERSMLYFGNTALARVRTPESGC